MCHVKVRRSLLTEEEIVQSAVCRKGSVAFWPDGAAVEIEQRFFPTTNGRAFGG
jgi:hypothetical protein